MTYIDREKADEAAEDLKIAIEAALDEANADLPTTKDDTGIPGWNERNVKINKLAYRAIDNFDLPILRTWFRYGQVEPHEYITAESITPQPFEEQTASPQTPNLDKRRYPSPMEIKEFLLSENLEEMIEQDIFEFLEDNYREFAPDDITDLYLANLELLKEFDRIHFRNQEDLDEDILDIYKRFKMASVNVRGELLANDRFNEIVENHVERGLHVCQDAILSYSQKEDPTSTQKQKLSRCRYVYHRYIWRWPAMIISIDEAIGPKFGRFEHPTEEMENIRKTCPSKIDELREELVQTGLQPKAEDYKSVHGSATQTVLGLERAAIEFD